ncbi:MAG TPA: hypothetical protein VFX48_08790, partial [Saprospiraceae bacterium]|nr:hypothetical protein [Saprospiraceae bacterium]
YHLSAVVGAAAFIYQVNIMVKPLVFMGMISYSFYLIHIQIGWTMMDGLVRYFPNGNLLIYLGISILFTIFASWLFYRFVEKPSHRLSRSIRYIEKTKE